METHIMFRHHLSRIGVAALALCLIFATTALAQPTGYEGYQVVRITVADEDDLKIVGQFRMLGHDFEVWSEVLRTGLIDVRVSPVGQAALRLSGLESKVVIEDLQQYLDARFAGPDAPEFFNSLRTYEEHVRFMNELAATYPDLAEVVDLGTSVQGRTMWTLHITGANHNKPGVFYHGAEHGNEAAGASVVNYIAWTLLDGYGTDPALTALVDRIDWWLMPIMNPDGYVAYQRYNANGVDLNRNWAGPGSGNDPTGGPFPFSEPETAALRDFLLARPDMLVHLDVHGYVPWIIWAWAHIPDPTPDHATFLYLGEGMRDRIAAAGGGVYTIGTIYDVAWYPISGCSTNYVYGVLDRWSMAIEMDHSDLPTICHEFLDALLFLGGWIWEFDCNANGVPDVEDIANGTSSDCNLNGIPDECEIAAGTVPDDNGNGIPDECECLWDCGGDNDNNVGIVDFLALLGQWGELGTSCDIDGGGVGITDFLTLLRHWGPCPK
jgi:hypothetical protein